MQFQIVVAVSKSNGIGKHGRIPWKLPPDMAYFQTLTTQSPHGTRNAVIMGRKTWDSLPDSRRPLPGRLNIVLSQQAESVPGAVVYRSLTDALEKLANVGEIHRVFVIGGSRLYLEAIESPRCEAIHITKVYIKPEPECDTFFPDIDPSEYNLWAATPVRRAAHDPIQYSFQTYIRRGSPVPALPRVAPRHEEYQYLDLIRSVMDTGYYRDDRTGTGTLSTFGTSMRFNLRHTFPLLTTKRVFWRGVVEELLWFIGGHTNAQLLKDKGVGIWDGNGSRAFLDSRGLTDREEMDLGPVYGFQWRHFGAKYKDMNTDYTGQGVDQLARVIHTIRTNPTDRRILMSAWNPADLDYMALPPCHMFCQFFVADGELSCQMYQRSCDLGLGVPFNIASYALLTRMIAHVTGLRPGDFIHVLGDTHVYVNHVEPLRRQLENVPRCFPQLRINSSTTDIDGFRFKDFQLIGYEPHGKIEMKMAV